VRKETETQPFRAGLVVPDGGVVKSITAEPRRPIVTVGCPGGAPETGCHRVLHSRSPMRRTGGESWGDTPGMLAMLRNLQPSAGLFRLAIHSLMAEATRRLCIFEHLISTFGEIKS
jgi:hypothetical protein